MIKMKKTVSLLVVLLMVVALVAMPGCSTKTDEEETTKATTAAETKATTAAETNATTKGETKATTAAATTAEKKEKLEISWLGINVVGIPISEGTYAQKYLEEKFDVIIKPVEIDTHGEGVNALYFAEGNYPDVFISLTSAGMDSLYGAFREIPQDMIDSHLPGYIKNQMELGEGNVKLAWDLVKKDGKIMGIPAAQSWGAYAYIMGVRSDWLDNVGMDAPKTIDEFEEMIKRFTEDDPNNSGENDTYGLASHQWYMYGVWPYIWGAYGLDPWTFGLKDGTVYPFATSPEYKEALKKIAGWYKAGYINPDLKMDRGIDWDDVAEGRTGTWSLDPHHALGDTSPLARLKANIPGADLEFIAPFTGPNGLSGSKGLRGYGSYAVFVGKNADDEKLAKILDIINAEDVDMEVYKTVKYGQLGVSYTEIDGVITMNPDMTPQQAMGKMGTDGSLGFFFTQNESRDKLATRMSDDVMRVFEAGYNATKVAEMNFLLMNYPNSASKNDYTGILIGIVDEFMFPAITGEIDIDAAWDEYVRLYMDSGGQILVDEFQAMVDAN